MSKIYPFKFLDSYTARDEDIFFGRDEETQALYEMIFQADIVLVYGASGTGKTSLIQCGLASRFEGHEWLDIFVRREEDINASLERSLNQHGAKMDQEVKLRRSLLDSLMGEQEGSKDESWQAASKLERAFQNIYKEHFSPIYLIFDQFEELFILGNKEERRAFVQSVREILRIGQPIKMLFSIREEYLGLLYEFEREVPELLRKKLRVEAVTQDKVKQILLGIHDNPATLVKLRTGEEEVIAETIFQKIRAKEKTLSIQLPYLQVFLDKLYLETTRDTGRQSEAVFSLEVLEQLGDIGDVLREFIEDQTVEIAEKMQAHSRHIWAVLSPLVTLEGTKEPSTLEELYPRVSELKPDFIQKALLALVDRRILRFSEQTQRYEVAHDSLARQIAEKRTDEQVAQLEVERLIQTQVRLKPEHRQLFTEPQLIFMGPFLKKMQLRPEEKAFIEQSQAKLQADKQQMEEVNRRKQRTRLGAIILIISLVLASLFGTYAYLQYKGAEEAKKIAYKQHEIALGKEQEAVMQNIEAEKRLDKANVAILKAKEAEKKALLAKILAEEQLEKANQADSIAKQALLAAQVAESIAKRKEEIAMDRVREAHLRTDVYSGLTELAMIDKEIALTLLQSYLPDTLQDANVLENPPFISPKLNRLLEEKKRLERIYE